MYTALQSDVTLQHYTTLLCYGQNLSHFNMLRYMLTVLFVNLEIFSSQFTWWSQNTEDAGRQAGWWDLLKKSEICGLYAFVPQSGVSTNPHNVGYGLGATVLFSFRLL